jgi:transcriptional regulator with XRE-family HTH domain
MPDNTNQPVGTSDLETILSRSPSIEHVLENYEESFITKDFAALLHKVFEKRGVSKALLAKRSGMSDVYLHQLFSGRRKPSRNKLLCLCIGMHATLAECQELLHANNNAALYARSRRDAVIEYGIMHGEKLTVINEKLFEVDEETLT